MSIEKIKDNCYFYHSDVVESIFLVVSILCDEYPIKSYEDFYDEELISKIKDKYRFVSEILNELFMKGSGILEPMFSENVCYLKNNDEILCQINDFATLDAYEDYLLSLSRDEFLYLYFAKFIERADIKEALQNAKKLSEIFDSHKYICKSFLGFKVFVDNIDIFIKDIFNCARDLQGKEFDNAMRLLDSQAEIQKKIILDKLNADVPLEVSQAIMGKTFHNRGPYKSFIFSSSIFLAYHAIRYFYNDQILFYSLKKDEMTASAAINTMKIIADESRFSIIELLAKNGPMIGKDLAKSLNIATSTLSHHIEQLRGGGFINEEREKNSKYYSLNPTAIDNIIGYLGKIIKK